MQLLNEDPSIKVRDFFTIMHGNCNLTMHRVLIGSLMAHSGRSNLRSDQAFVAQLVRAWV